MVERINKIVDLLAKMAALDEYWADDSDAPQWRVDKHIGTVIK